MQFSKCEQQCKKDHQLYNMAQLFMRFSRILFFFLLYVASFLITGLKVDYRVERKKS